MPFLAGWPTLSPSAPRAQSPHPTGEGWETSKLDPNSSIRQFVNSSIRKFFLHHFSGIDLRPTRTYSAFTASSSQLAGASALSVDLSPASGLQGTPHHVPRAQPLTSSHRLHNRLALCEPRISHFADDRRPTTDDRRPTTRNPLPRNLYRNSHPRYNMLCFALDRPHIQAYCDHPIGMWAPPADTLPQAISSKRRPR